MQITWYNRIQVRLGISLVLFTTLFLAAFCFYGYSSAKTSLQDELSRLVETTAGRLARNLAEPMSRRDKEHMAELISSEMADDRIAAILVKDVDRSVILKRESDAPRRATHSWGDPEEGRLSAVRTVLHGGMALGRVEVSVGSASAADQVKRSVLHLSAVTLGLNAFIFLTLFISLRRTLIRPMIELTRATEDISLGRVEEPITVRSQNELGHLAEAIERMRISIRTAIERLARTKMEVPGSSAREWGEVVLEKRNYGFENLALRILVGRLAVSYRNDPRPETMRECVRRLVEFFQTNRRNPQAQKDLGRIFGGVRS